MSAHGVATGTMGLDTAAPLPRPHPLLATPRRLLRMHSDGALAERFRAGDQDAFAVLYERHRASVLAVCIGVLGSRHDAEDAAQDAFASAAVALRASTPRDLRAWLARVARNAAIDVIRRRRAVTPADETLEGRASGGTEVRAEWDLVLAGLRELPESQRTALLMRELGGHSYLEIADLLETDEAAVRGLIARGRIGLRAHREATEMPCAAARAALAAEPDGRRRDRTVRRHLRTCSSCKAYGRGLRKDARDMRTLLPAPLAGLAGGGAIFGGFAAKTVLTGGVLTQVTAACAVSVCAVGGVALLDPGVLGHHRQNSAKPAAATARPRGKAGLVPEARAPAPIATARTSRIASVRAPTVTHPSSVASRSAVALGRATTRATKVISTASIVLGHELQLPRSQAPAPTTPPAATAGATPTATPTSPPQPVLATPTPWHGLPSTGSSPRWGASPTPSGGNNGSSTQGGSSGATTSTSTGGTGPSSGGAPSPTNAGGTNTGTGWAPGSTNAPSPSSPDHAGRRSTGSGLGFW
jgi:RNA polymerase sigma factor (sigma-70 family)